MPNDSTQIQVSTPQEIDGWLIANLESIGANIKLKVGSSEKVVWATFKPPDLQPVQVALPQYPGASTQPVDTVTLQNVHDIAVQIITTLENSIRETYKGDF